MHYKSELERARVASLEEHVLTTLGAAERLPVSSRGTSVPVTPEALEPALGSSPDNTSFNLTLSRHFHVLFLKRSTVLFDSDTIKPNPFSSP